MPRLGNRVPKYRRHRQSGQAIVTINGRDYLLGRHGTKASEIEYDRLITEWLSSGRSSTFGVPEHVVTITEPVVAYLEHARAYYGGGSRGEYANMLLALRPLRRLYGRTEARAFGPKQLKAVRPPSGKGARFGRSMRRWSRLYHTSKLTDRRRGGLASAVASPASVHLASVDSAGPAAARQNEEEVASMERRRGLVRLTSTALIVVLGVASTSGKQEAPAFRIDAEYPGGNILVREIDGDVVHIAQDLRDTSSWWFYYNFRVRGAAGRELVFRWTNRNPMAALGPAVSADGGRSWNWLGRERIRGDSFSYRFAEDADEVHFCLAMPYQLADLERFIAARQNTPHFRQALHATSNKGRPVHRLHVGRLDGEPQHRVVFTARHHACEMMASYVLEGVIDAFLADTDDGRWLRRNVELLAVPLMDVDGVEEGDQGKRRRPHDHNRDYEGTPLYSSVAANKEFIPHWSANKLRVAIDLHCPWVRGGGDSPGSHEQIYFVGSPNQRIWQEMLGFSRILEESQTGPLVHASRHNLPWGRSWNTSPPDEARSFSRWAASLPGVRFASAIEFPYAVAGGQPVTSDAARAFGHDLAKAMRIYLQRLEGQPP